ncbi:DMT family transporter [Sulfurospirillum sp. 1612]|uniref:DMT family transporter n=1 Tax=Sulfurospirillum sp. 1612 TaxID=3094835 RepID=UPI002F92E63B
MPVFFLLILCVLFWSGNFVIGRFVHSDIDPLQLAFFRWLGAAVFMLPVIIVKFGKITKVIKEHFLILTLLSWLGITAFNTLLYVGLQYTTATNALLINSFIPILILVFSFFILKIRISPKQFTGILISTLGVIFLVLRGQISTLSTLELNQGDIWIIVSSLTWALYSVLVKFKPKELNDLEFFTTIVFVGLFWLFLIYKFMGYSVNEDMAKVYAHPWVFVYVSFFTSVLSFYFWHQGIHHIGANKTGQFTHLMPLFGSILAYLFLGEKLHLYHIFGALLIATGIYLSLFSKRKGII